MAKKGLCTKFETLLRKEVPPPGTSMSLPKTITNASLDEQLNALVEANGSISKKLLLFSHIFSTALPDYPHIARQIPSKPEKVRMLLHELHSSFQQGETPVQVPAIGIGDDSLGSHEAIVTHYLKILYTALSDIATTSTERVDTSVRRTPEFSL